MTIGGGIDLFGFQPAFVFAGTPDGPTGQWENQFYLLAHGGRGSGKTASGTIRLIHYCLQWPGARIVVIAPTVPYLNSNVLPVIWEFFEILGMVKGRDFTYNKEEKDLRAFGCEILFRTTEDPESVKVGTAAAVWMDEAAMSPLRAFMNLQGVMRQKGYPHQCWITTTPNGRISWLCKLFYPEKALYMPGETHLRPDLPGATFKAWPARTRDNPFEGEQLYQSMIATYGVNSPIARQELNGEFVLLEGLVYDRWNPDVHIVPIKDWPEWPRLWVAGVDFGFTNPAAIIPYGIDSLKRRYIPFEYYKRQVDEPELGAKAVELAKALGIRVFFCDSADPGKIKMLNRVLAPLGARAFKAFKKRGSAADLSSGIGLCYRAVSRQIDDPLHPELNGQAFFVANAPNFVREIEGYVYDDPLPSRNPIERPRVFDQHALDGWRYGEAGVSRVYDPPGGFRSAQSIKIVAGRRP